MYTRHSLRFALLSFFLRTFFKLLYQPLAWTYDWVADIVSVGMWKDWVMTVQPFISGSHILEIGHGPGHLLAALNQPMRTIIGIDRSSQMSHIAYRRLSRENILPKLIISDAQCLPLENSCIDNIVATFPSEYILDPHTLAESYRVLKPGAKLIIVPYAWITGTKLLHKAAAWLFNVTGESPKPGTSSLQSLHEAGFMATEEKIILKSSIVLIIQAKKPSV